MEHITLPRSHACALLACMPPYAGRGWLSIVQIIVETAVMVEGVDKAKRLCIDHTNAKKQSALMVACKHGCVSRNFAVPGDLTLVGWTFTAH